MPLPTDLESECVYGSHCKTAMVGCLASCDTNLFAKQTEVFGQEL